MNSNQHYNYPGEQFVSPPTQQVVPDLYFDPMSTSTYQHQAGGGYDNMGVGSNMGPVGQQGGGHQLQYSSPMTMQPQQPMMMQHQQHLMQQQQQQNSVNMMQHQQHFHLQQQQHQQMAASQQRQQIIEQQLLQQRQQQQQLRVQQQQMAPNNLMQLQGTDGSIQYRRKTVDENMRLHYTSLPAPAQPRAPVNNQYHQISPPSNASFTNTTVRAGNGTTGNSNYRDTTTTGYSNHMRSGSHSTSNGSGVNSRVPPPVPGQQQYSGQRYNYNTKNMSSNTSTAVGPPNSSNSTVAYSPPTPGNRTVGIGRASKSTSEQQQQSGTTRGAVVPKRQTAGLMSQRDLDLKQQKQKTLALNKYKNEPGAGDQEQPDDQQQNKKQEGKINVSTAEQVHLDATSNEAARSSRDVGHQEREEDIKRDSPDEGDEEQKLVEAVEERSCASPDQRGTTTMGSVLRGNKDEFDSAGSSHCSQHDSLEQFVSPNQDEADSCNSLHSSPGGGGGKTPHEPISTTVQQVVKRMPQEPKVFSSSSSAMNNSLSLEKDKDAATSSEKLVVTSTSSTIGNKKILATQDESGCSGGCGTSTGADIMNMLAINDSGVSSGASLLDDCLPDSNKNAVADVAASAKGDIEQDGSPADKCATSMKTAPGSTNNCNSKSTTTTPAAAAADLFPGTRTKAELCALQERLEGVVESVHGGKNESSGSTEYAVLIAPKDFLGSVLLHWSDVMRRSGIDKFQMGQKFSFKLAEAEVEIVQLQSSSASADFSFSTPTTGIFGEQQELQTTTTKILYFKAVSAEFQQGTSPLEMLALATLRQQQKDVSGLIPPKEEAALPLEEAFRIRERLRGEVVEAMYWHHGEIREGKYGKVALLRSKNLLCDHGILLADVDHRVHFWGDNHAKRFAKGQCWEFELARNPKSRGNDSKKEFVAVAAVYGIGISSGSGTTTTFSTTAHSSSGTNTTSKSRGPLPTASSSRTARVLSSDDWRASAEKQQSGRGYLDKKLPSGGENRYVHPNARTGGGTGSVSGMNYAPDGNNFSNYNSSTPTPDDKNYHNNINANSNNNFSNRGDKIDYTQNNRIDYTQKQNNYKGSGASSSGAADNSYGGSSNVNTKTWTSASSSNYNNDNYGENDRNYSSGGYYSQQGNDNNNYYNRNNNKDASNGASSSAGDNDDNSGSSSWYDHDGSYAGQGRGQGGQQHDEYKYGSTSSSGWKHDDQNYHNKNSSNTTNNSEDKDGSSWYVRPDGECGGGTKQAKAGTHKKSSGTTSKSGYHDVANKNNYKGTSKGKKSSGYPHGKGHNDDNYSSSYKNESAGYNNDSGWKNGGSFDSDYYNKKDHFSYDRDQENNADTEHGSGTSSYHNYKTNSKTEYNSSYNNNYRGTSSASDSYYNYNCTKDEAKNEAGEDYNYTSKSAAFEEDRGTSSAAHQQTSAERAVDVVKPSQEEKQVHAEVELQPSKATTATEAAVNANGQGPGGSKESAFSNASSALVDCEARNGKRSGAIEVEKDSDETNIAQKSEGQLFDNESDFLMKMTDETLDVGQKIPAPQHDLLESDAQQDALNARLKKDDEVLDPQMEIEVCSAVQRDKFGWAVHKSRIANDEISSYSSDELSECRAEADREGEEQEEGKNEDLGAAASSTANADVAAGSRENMKPGESSCSEAVKDEEAAAKELPSGSGPTTEEQGQEVDLLGAATPPGRGEQDCSRGAEISQGAQEGAQVQQEGPSSILAATKNIEQVTEVVENTVVYATEEDIMSLLMGGGPPPRGRGASPSPAHNQEPKGKEPPPVPSDGGADSCYDLQNLIDLEMCGRGAADHDGRELQQQLKSTPVELPTKNIVSTSTPAALGAPPIREIDDILKDESDEDDEDVAKIIDQHHGRVGADAGLVASQKKNGHQHDERLEDLPPAPVDGAIEENDKDDDNLSDISDMNLAVTSTPGRAAGAATTITIAAQQLQEQEQLAGLQAKSVDLIDLSLFAKDEEVVNNGNEVQKREPSDVSLTSAERKMSKFFDLDDIDDIDDDDIPKKQEKKEKQKSASSTSREEVLNSSKEVAARGGLPTSVHPSRPPPTASGGPTTFGENYKTNCTEERNKEFDAASAPKVSENIPAVSDERIKDVATTREGDVPVILKPEQDHSCSDLMNTMMQLLDRAGNSNGKLSMKEWQSSLLQTKGKNSLFSGVADLDDDWMSAMGGISAKLQPEKKTKKKIGTAAEDVGHQETRNKKSPTSGPSSSTPQRGPNSEVDEDPPTPATVIVHSTRRSFSPDVDEQQRKRKMVPSPRASCVSDNMENPIGAEGKAKANSVAGAGGSCADRTNHGTTATAAPAAASKTGSTSCSSSKMITATTTTTTTSRAKNIKPGVLLPTQEEEEEEFVVEKEDHEAQDNCSASGEKFNEDYSRNSSWNKNSSNKSYDSSKWDRDEQQPDWKKKDNKASSSWGTNKNKKSPWGAGTGSWSADDHRDVEKEDHNDKNWGTGSWTKNSNHDYTNSGTNMKSSSSSSTTTWGEGGNSNKWGNGHGSWSSNKWESSKKKGGNNYNNSWSSSSKSSDWNKDYDEDKWVSWDKNQEDNDHSAWRDDKNRSSLVIKNEQGRDEGDQLCSSLSDNPEQDERTSTCANNENNYRPNKRSKNHESKYMPQENPIGVKRSTGERRNLGQFAVEYEEGNRLNFDFKNRNPYFFYTQAADEQRFPCGVVEGTGPIITQLYHNIANSVEWNQNEKGDEEEEQLMVEEESDAGSDSDDGDVDSQMSGLTTMTGENFTVDRNLPVNAQLKLFDFWMNENFSADGSAILSHQSCTHWKSVLARKWTEARLWEAPQSESDYGLVRQLLQARREYMDYLDQPHVQQSHKVLKPMLYADILRWIVTVLTLEEEKEEGRYLKEQGRQLQKYRQEKDRIQRQLREKQEKERIELEERMQREEEEIKQKRKDETERREKKKALEREMNASVGIPLTQASLDTAPISSSAPRSRRPKAPGPAAGGEDALNRSQDSAYQYQFQ